jgi:hypothetical protein
VSGFQFKRAELVEEVVSLKKIAAPFLDVRTQYRLDGVLAQLKDAPRSRAVTWEIPREDPLVTEPSFGDYEQEGRQGGHLVVGSLAFQWQIELRDDLAEVTGNASTKIALTDHQHDEGDARRNLGIWHMDIGGADAPGACFHVQVIGDDAGPPFPPSLPVPRFPTLVPTPMAALEFLLGELFQDKWRLAVGSGQGESTMWRSLQRRRWQALLAWQHNQVTDGTPSPWTALKRFPPTDMFVKP